MALLCPPLICLVMFSTWCVAVISLSILKQMDVNQNLQLRVNKRLLVCLSLYGGEVWITIDLYNVA